MKEIEKSERNLRNTVSYTQGCGRWKWSFNESEYSSTMVDEYYFFF